MLKNIEYAIRNQINIKKGGYIVNKAELVASMAEKSNLTKKDAESALNAFMKSVEEALAGGEKVQLVGFGTFEVRDRKERVGRNPRTKEEIKIPASKVPVFKPGKEFKEKVNVVPKKKKAAPKKKK